MPVLRERILSILVPVAVASLFGLTTIVPLLISVQYPQQYGFLLFVGIGFFLVWLCIIEYAGTKEK